jgi:hypothetical protein
MGVNHGKAAAHNPVKAARRSVFRDQLASVNLKERLRQPMVGQPDFDSQRVTDSSDQVTKTRPRTLEKISRDSLQKIFPRMTLSQNRVRHWARVPCGTQLVLKR